MLMKQAAALMAMSLAHVVSAASEFAIPGAPVEGGGDIPIRRDINELQANGGPQWDLYIRALKSLQEKDAHDPLSYFQVAGIHGLPFIEWNNGGSLRSNGWQGYCPHGENIFLSWHRPFILLFEQLLVAEAKTLAAQYPGQYRDQYMDAANTLRQPYWDWSSTSDVPPATVPPSITVYAPDGDGISQVTIDNPLQSYEFPQAALGGEFGTFPQNERTVRCPAPDSFPGTANQNLASRSFRQSTYDAFTYSTNYNEFAATRANGVGLEEMHNAVHWDVGCGGQFLNPETSGFDPMFMLHHTNVDRLWTYWQFINPSEAMFKDSYPGQARYSTPQGTIITPDSPLQPFSDRNDQYYTSSSVTSIQGMGYTYEGLQYTQKSPDQLKQDATQLINRLYAPSQPASSKRAISLAQAETRYFARVEVDRTQIDRPCSVNVFIGGKSAGSVIVMRLPEVGIMHGSLAVDELVQESIAADGSSDDPMTLIEHLVEIDIRKPDGTVVPLDSAHGLKVTIEKVSVTPAKSGNEFPTPKESKKVDAELKQRHG